MTRRTRIEPTLRPELTGIAGTINLPEYLQRPETLHKDVRGGAISLVKGSTASESIAFREPRDFSGEESDAELGKGREMGSDWEARPCNAAVGKSSVLAVTKGVPSTRQKFRPSFTAEPGVYNVKSGSESE